MKRFTFLIVLLMIVTMLFSFAFATTENAETVEENKLVENITSKDRKIAEYTDKYNDATYGKVAYYLSIVQKYSIPVCIIGLTIGALNFFIIGNKKLDKKEQGFGMIVGFLIGLVVFQILPLIFAILVAGR